MYKSFVFVIFLFAFGNQTICAQNTSLELKFKEVECYIELKDSIKQVKEERINQFKDSLSDIREFKGKEKEFRMLVKLAKEYEYFVYDSAFHYSMSSISLAYDLGDKAKIAEAKSNIALVLLLKGLYKESIDTLKTIDASVLNVQKRIDFYSIAYRSYFDLANSRWGYFAPKYRELGDRYVEKIVEEGDPESFDYKLALILQSQNRDEGKTVQKNCLKLLSDYQLNNHQSAITNCVLGISYLKEKENEKAKFYLLQAVVNDIESSTKETLAAKVLAELLFHDGDFQKANKFISEAQKDARFFGSNARRLEISYIQPDIKAAVLSKVEKEKNFVFLIFMLVSILALLLIILALIIYRQLRELRKARGKILESNANLLHVNEMLREVSKIKEEYVGYYFNFSSQFIEKMEGMKKAISRQLMTKQYDAIEKELKNYNSKKERQYLFEDFDRIFLKLFPDFVNRFNLLFDKDDRLVLKDSQSMNTDLRIFALIRLGISDNDKIASILNFSVNTIYTYKTKIKNRSLISNDKFDEKIMEIKSV